MVKFAVEHLLFIAALKNHENVTIYCVNTLKFMSVCQSE
jgi:hypothetical protein